METGVMKAAKSVHSMVDIELAAGISPGKIFLCGFSQGFSQGKFISQDKFITLCIGKEAGLSFERTQGLNVVTRRWTWTDPRRRGALIFAGVVWGPLGCHFTEGVNIHKAFKCYKREVAARKRAGDCNERKYTLECNEKVYTRL
ncbi:hypothetical protein R1flu_009502 [Riccia fluitans]|uniref:Phospholipase/carboxylesterase/thioesterase domain-containing protein n=1 Tax=Riccia fluitans TaxID=41844 RepID=A0ABD1Z334_9MARC